jgi:hypothetical protein
MSMKLVVAVAIVMLALLIAVFALGHEAPPSAAVETSSAPVPMRDTKALPTEAIAQESRASTPGAATELDARADTSAARDASSNVSTPSHASAPRTARASLAARVVDVLGHPVSAAHVRLCVDVDESIERRRSALESFDDDEMQHWIGETDDDGRCSIANLPASLKLRPRIARGPRIPVVDMDPISLASGERREIEWRLTDGFEVTGVVRDQTDAPVADLEVLLARPAAGLTPAYQIYSESDIVARARTDRAGRFRLRAVPAGTWWLGPEPLGGPNQHTRDVAATALEIEVSPRSESLDFTLHVARGLEIRGRVVDPSGAPAGRQWITAQEQGSEVSFSVPSSDDGRFRIAPLRAGTCVLYAGGGADSAGSAFLAPSKPVTARTGDDDVVLELELGGALTVRAVDRRTSTGTPAQIWLSPRGASSASLVEGTSAPDGTYRFAHLSAGTYDIGAQSSAMCGIAKSVVIEPNAETKGVVVMLDPNATLLVRYESSAPRASVGVKLDGVLLPGGGVLARGSSMNVPVPAGRSTLETHFLGQDKPLERTIDATVGEVREVVITDRE